MQWARDVAEETRIGIRSAKSLLTVTTLVTVVGMVVDPIVVRDLLTTGVIDVIATTISSVAEVAIAIVISATIEMGVVAGKQEAGILDTLHTHSHNGLPGISRMWRNWQTRRSQKPVMVTSWRFKSSHPHQIFIRASQNWLALMIFINVDQLTCSETCSSGWEA
jgi:hypothetical protein